MALPKQQLKDELFCAIGIAKTLSHLSHLTLICRVGQLGESKADN